MLKLYGIRYHNIGSIRNAESQSMICIVLFSICIIFLPLMPVFLHHYVNIFVKHNKTHVAMHFKLQYDHLY